MKKLLLRALLILIPLLYSIYVSAAPVPAQQEHHARNDVKAFTPQSSVLP